MDLYGKTYFLVCEKITGKKPWFGAFAFGEGNPYRAGKFWLHSDHDLVFRTYVGKTPQQVANEQIKDEISEKMGLPSESIPKKLTDFPEPLPISQTSVDNIVIKTEGKTDTLNMSLQNTNETSKEEVEQLNFIKIPNEGEQEQNQTKDNKSLFNRLFNRN